MRGSADHWHHAIYCHDSVWELGLTQNQILCLTYLSSFCQRGFPISIIKMSKALRMKPQRVKEAIDELIARKMVSKTTHFGRASTFMVITRTSKTWGQTDLPLAPNGPTHLGPNGPTTYVQTDLLTTNLDTEFLILVREHIPKWQFNKKPVGSHFVFTRGMQHKCLEMMRWIHGNMPGYGTKSAFHKFLTSCGEYLGHERDVLSPAKDMRALSPAKWLHDWPEQIRLVGIYIDEQERKIVHSGIEPIKSLP